MRSTLVLALVAALVDSSLSTPLDIISNNHALLMARGCSTPDGDGTCLATSQCTTGGFHVAGYCPGATDIQCCITKTCVTPSGSGVCMNTANSCSGKFVSGYCPGPSDVQCCTGEKCSTSSGAGACQVTSTTCSNGKYIAGACPGPDNVECCVASSGPPTGVGDSCTTSSGSGTCALTSSPCNGGKYIPGACPGATDVQCCVKSSSPPPPPPASSSAPTPPTGSNLPGVDFAGTQSSSFWTCAKQQGIQKVVVRGYQQACGEGGAVDPDMVTSYKAAKAAGISNFDPYLFPCTGTTNGVQCKSISDQLNAFLAEVDNAGIKPVHYWLDIEPTNVSTSPCNSWQLGASANEALAKQWVAAIKATGRPWGIYANAGQWTEMFASIDTDIGSDLPLWAVQDDDKPGVGTTTRFMGGWTKAYAKQYLEPPGDTDTLCSAEVDLDSFSG